MAEQFFIVYHRGGPSRPLTISDLRRMARAGALRDSTLVQRETKAKPARASRHPELAAIMSEAKCLRLITEVYRLTAAGRVGAARRAAKRLERLSRAIPGDPFAPTARDFLEKLKQLRQSGGLAASLTYLAAGLISLLAVVLFFHAVRKKGIELVLGAQSGVTRALEGKKEQEIRAELDGLCHLIDRSPQVRLARLAGLGSVDQWLAGAIKQQVELRKGMEEKTKSRMALEVIRGRAEKLMLDNRYREAMDVVREAPDAVAGPEAEAFAAEMTTAVRGRSAEYLAESAARIRRLLLENRFEEAHRQTEALDKQLVAGVGAGEVTALEAQVARGEQVTKFLADAQKAAEAGRLEELEKLLGQIEASYANQPVPQAVAKRIAGLRQTGGERAAKNTRDGLGAVLEPLVAAHRYGEARKILAEAENNAPTAPFARERAAALDEKLGAELQELKAKVRELSGKLQYAEAFALVEAYGRTGLAEPDAKLKALRDEMVSEARRLVGELKKRAEALAVEGDAAESQKTMESFGEKQTIADTGELAKEARAYIEALNRGVTFMKYAAGFERSKKPAEAQYYYGRALEVLPPEHRLRIGARSKLEALKKEEKR